MISVAISTALFSPTYFVFAIVNDVNNRGPHVIPNNQIHLSDWGTPLEEESFLRIDEKYGTLHILWLSLLENSCYEFITPLRELACKGGKLLIGCSCFGKICFWDYEQDLSKIIFYGKGQCVDELVRKRLMLDDIVLEFGNESYKLSELRNYFSNNIPREIRSKVHIEDILDNYMRQFVYRYVFAIRKDYNKKVSCNYNYFAEFDYIEESLYDGSHNKLRDGGLMEYHQAGKPKKLRVEWHVGKAEYSAYFWFEDEKIREVFDRFYRDYPETKTDFIIRIDGEQKKYELSLFKEGLEEPQIIPEDVYQLLVFKNKFEDYRSKNYNQERGTWIW